MKFGSHFAHASSLALLGGKVETVTVNLPVASRKAELKAAADKEASEKPPAAKAPKKVVEPKAKVVENEGNTLLKMSKNELKAMAKKLGLPVAGTKADLAVRIKEAQGANT